MFNLFYRIRVNISGLTDRFKSVNIFKSFVYVGFFEGKIILRHGLISYHSRESVQS